MAKEIPNDPKAPPQPAPAAPPAKESFSLKKLLMIGVPVLLFQVVIVYFLVAKFAAPRPVEGAAVATTDKKSDEGETTQIVVIKDVIVNPAGTNGTRFLVTTVGLEVPTVEAKTELEQKEVQARDALITVLAGKRLDELQAPDSREALRDEIQKNVDKFMKSAKLKRVYISKFIIQ